MYVSSICRKYSDLMKFNEDYIISLSNVGYYQYFRTKDDLMGEGEFNFSLLTHGGSFTGEVPVRNLSIVLSLVSIVSILLLSVIIFIFFSLTVFTG